MAPDQPRRFAFGSGWQDTRLIRTKLLLPSLEPGWVDRPRLQQKLDRASRKALTLLVAPSGSGKTSLLGGWAVQQNRQGSPVAWVTLDERDNQLERFFLYLWSALGETGLKLHSVNGSARARDPQGAFEHLLYTWINQIIEQGKEIYLVLDDYHQIENDQVHACLELLLNHLPPDMHILIASRRELPLSVGTYRARGQVLELGFKDLCFEYEEVRRFLVERMGLPGLSEDLIQTLEQRTEGWIAGLQLAALTLRDRQGRLALAERFDGRHPYVVEFLAEQVWRGRPELERRFLMETAVAERLNVDLCRALTGIEAAAPLLERLAAGNLFLIPLDDRREWYRYHPLFRSFLLDRLEREGERTADELHRIATRWFEANGFIAEAVDHALASGADDQAAEMIEQVAEELWISGDNARLSGWLGALPEEVLACRPLLSIYHAWALNISGDFSARDARLQQVENFLASGAAACVEVGSSLRGILNVVYGINACMDRDPQAARRFSEQALEQLGEDDPVWRAVAYRNLGMASLLADRPAEAQAAFADSLNISARAACTYISLVVHFELAEQLILQGELHQAEHLCRQGLRLAQRVGSPDMTMAGAIRVSLGEILRLWNRLEESQRMLESGIAIGRRNRSLGIQISGNARLALAAQASGDEAHANQARQRVLELAPVFQRTALIAHQESQAALWGRAAASPAARRWFRQLELDTGGEIDVNNEAAYLAYARMLALTGRCPEAVLVLQRLAVSADNGGRNGRLIEVHLLHARCAEQQGENERALQLLLPALEAAEPEGILRPFLDEGPPLARLLRRVPDDHPSRRFAGRLLRELLPQMNAHTDALENMDPALSAALVEPLTGRELEVLGLIAQGMTNEQVADELYLAVSTIQWHTKNIYSKLDVHSRTQAVHRAQELGFLA